MESLYGEAMQKVTQVQSLWGSKLSLGKPNKIVSIGLKITF